MAGLYTRNLTSAPSVTGTSLLASSEETTDELFKTTVNDVSTSFVDVEASTSLKAPYIQATTGVTDWPIKNELGTDLATFSDDGVSFPQQPASSIYLFSSWNLNEIGAFAVIPFNTIRFQTDNSQGWNVTTHKYHAPKDGVYSISMRFSLNTRVPVAAGRYVEIRVSKQGSVVIGYHRIRIWAGLAAAVYWWGPSISVVTALSLGDEVYFEAADSGGGNHSMTGGALYGAEAYISKVS